MGIMLGLAVALIIFEGIITQCEGAPNVAGSSGYTDNYIEFIIRRGTMKMDGGGVRYICKEFKNYTFICSPVFPNYEDRLSFPEDDKCIRFESVEFLKKYFVKCGDLVYKLQIHFDDEMENELREALSIIIGYAVNLEELQIACDGDDNELWKIISNEAESIHFPKVKKFHFCGNCRREEFKLNSIFPNLESVKLVGSITDADCLADVEALKELHLFTESIKENQLESILSKNVNITAITLTGPQEPTTLELIANKLMKLETIYLNFPGKHFLFRTTNQSDYHYFPSVTHFIIEFDGMRELVGDLSFDMPGLERLSLSGKQADNRIIGFIGNFNRLESVEVIRIEYDAIEGIQEIKKFFEKTQWTPSQGTLNTKYKNYLMFERKSSGNKLCNIM